MITDAQYIIVEAYDVPTLSKLVRSYLRDKWQLQGGVSIAPTDITNRYYYAQAMFLPAAPGPR